MELMHVGVLVPDEDLTWSLTHVGVPIPGEDCTWSLTLVGVRGSVAHARWCFNAR